MTFEPETYFRYAFIFLQAQKHTIKKFEKGFMCLTDKPPHNKRKDVVQELAIKILRIRVTIFS